MLLIPNDMIGLGFCEMTNRFCKPIRITKDDALYDLIDWFSNPTYILQIFSLTNSEGLLALKSLIPDTKKVMDMEVHNKYY